MSNSKQTSLISKTLILSFILVMSCKNDDDNSNQQISSNPPFEYVETLNLKKDKAKYHPAEEVIFFVDAVSPNTVIKYKYLGQTIEEAPLTSTSWQWSPPSDDFKGY